MKKKILMITPFPPSDIGGAESFACVLLEALCKQFSVDLITFKRKRQKVWRGLNLWEGLNIVNDLLKMVMEKLGGKDYGTERYDYDVLMTLGLNAGIVAYLSGKRYSITLLALYKFSERNFIFKYICKKILRRATYVFVEGEGGRKDVECFNLGILKVVQFTHWCDQNIFFMKQRENPPINILFIGRPIPEKGKQIIKDCEKYFKNRKEVVFNYVEEVKYSNIAEYYQSADILVVPSLYAEGHTRVVVEAASCGCAIITSDRGSLPEQVNGFGVSVPAIPVYFAFAIFKVIKDLRDYQVRSFKYAAQNFSEKNAEVFISRI